MRVYQGDSGKLYKRAHDAANYGQPYWSNSQVIEYELVPVRKLSTYEARNLARNDARSRRLQEKKARLVSQLAAIDAVLSK